MAAVAMRPSRRVFACGRGSTPSGGRSHCVRRPSISVRSESCFPTKNRADPEDCGAAMPIDRAELGVPAELAVAAVYTREVRVGIACARSPATAREAKSRRCWRGSARSGPRSKCAFICLSTGRTGSRRWARNIGRATRVSETRTKR